MLFKRSVSPLIATILLIVVSVILITVVLTWGSDFARDKLSTAKNLSTQNIDLTGLISSRSISSQNILISNNSSQDLNITGYKIISSIDHYLCDYFENKIYNLDEPLIIDPNSAQSLQIDCYPENSFFIDLITDQNTYVRTQISARSINDVDSLRCGLVLDFDSTTGELKENTGKTVINNNVTFSNLSNGNYSAEFNGSNSYLDFGNFFNIDHSDFGINFWINTNNFGEVNANYFFGKYQNSNNRWYLRFEHNNSRTLQFYSVVNENPSIGFARSFTIDNYLNEWVMITLILERDVSWKIFFDGIEIANIINSNSSYSIDVSNTGNFFLGRYSSAFFTGKVGSFRIWKRNLTAIEINNLYNKEKGVYP